MRQMLPLLLVILFLLGFAYGKNRERERLAREVAKPACVCGEACPCGVANGCGCEARK